MEPKRSLPCWPGVTDKAGRISIRVENREEYDMLSDAFHKYFGRVIWISGTALWNYRPSSMIFPTLLYINDGYSGKVSFGDPKHHSGCPPIPAADYVSLLMPYQFSYKVDEITNLI